MSAAQSGIPADPHRAASPELGAIFMEIAAHAHTATEILHTAISEGGCVNLDAAAISVLHKVGWLADSMVSMYGGARMCGDAEDWLLSPLARSSLAALRGEPVADGGEGGAA